MTTATTTEEHVADALRTNAAKLQTALDEGHMGAVIDLHDVIEILLNIANDIAPA